ncbi:hypothetical protein BGX26_010492 [Mortierella sp. AD094]|nr:hypothetical protein BGX26_010492 [Mortierella sp. AD094]
MTNPTKTETFEEAFTQVSEQTLIPDTHGPAFGGHGAHGAVAVGLPVLEHKHHEGEHKHHHEDEHKHHHEHKPQDPLTALSQNNGATFTHLPTM